MGRITGILYCYGLGTVLKQTGVPDYWRIMFVMPGAMAVIQSLLIFLFVPDSPIDLLKRGAHDDLEAYVSVHYHEEHKEKVITEYRVEHEMQQNAL